ncbi:MAG: hypothetical protein ABSA76_14165 [Bacteroidales bacterium]
MAFSTTATGFLVERFHRWDVSIVVSGVILFIGALLWLRIDPTRSVLHEAPQNASPA